MPKNEVWGKNHRDKKDQLSAKVEEFAPASDLKSKGEHQQKRKCSQCGKGYLGQKNSDTCSGACRVAKHRG